MTLQVPFVSFTATAAKLVGGSPVFVAPNAGGTLVTAADPAWAIVVAALAPSPPDAVRSELEAAGLEVLEGAWTLREPSELATATEAFVAAVAYQSAEYRPGVWIDAYPTLPTQVQVLRGMYDEMRQTGELSEVSFEEFVRLANPTVVILSPSDLRSFLSQKSVDV